MSMLRLIVTLLTPRRLWHLYKALRCHGTNLMALLAYARFNAPEHKALSDEQEELGYESLYHQSTQLALYLKASCQLKPGDQVLLIGRNSIPFIQSIFALSNLGIHTSLLNPSLKAEAYAQFLSRKSYRLLIVDQEVDLGTDVRLPLLYTDHASETSIRKLVSQPSQTLPFLKGNSGKLTVLSSGSTGAFKEAPRKPSLSAFADPVLDLTGKLGIRSHEALFIAVPVFHGFGLAALFMAMFFSKTVYLRRRFQADAVAETILKHRIDCLAVVPLMLQKLLEQEWPQTLLKCIISGGDKLNPTLVARSLEAFGPVLYNLYGTSEAGVCILATPQDLAKYPVTIGKPLQGTTVRIFNSQGLEALPGESGELAVSAAWAMEQAGGFVRTGDLAERNPEGFYVLKGRKDDMLIIGGENVFPVELEQVVYQHPGISWAKAEGFEDAQGNTQIRLTLYGNAGASLRAEEVRQWLESRLPRHLKPAVIEVPEQQPMLKLM